MNVWLCPVKPKSWRVIKKSKVFGVPRNNSLIERVRPGDLLVIHVFKPINGIIAICKVVSEVYEDYSDLWGKGRYPMRVKIHLDQKFLLDESNAIPLSYLFSKNVSNDVEIEPYLRNIWITKISQDEYKILEEHFKNRCFV